MKRPIRKYARLGFVHHMLYPECAQDPLLHMRTLIEFMHREDIETFDCCLPYDRAYQKQVAEAAGSCGKTGITFSIHFFPLRKLFLSSTLPHEQYQIRMILSDMIEQAAMIKAKYFIFAAGGPPYLQAGPAEFRAFAEMVKWLCAALDEYKITALLEPFDFDVDKKFIYGPTRECVRLINDLRPEAANLGIELDYAHVPLMHETFEDATRACAPYLRRVHLGNCVCKEANHPLYGDMHPPMGFPGGEIDVPELARILSVLLESGYLNSTSRGDLLIETTPWPGKSMEETIADQFERLALAWSRVPDPAPGGPGQTPLNSQREMV